MLNLKKIFVLGLALFTLSHGANALAGSRGEGSKRSSERTVSWDENITVAISRGENGCSGQAEGFEAASRVAQRALEACYNNGCKKCRTAMIVGGGF